jgi:predicted dehydrogenase
LHGTGGYAVLEGYEIQQWKAASDYVESPLGLPEIELDPALASQLFFGPGHVLQVTEFIQDVRNGKPPAVPAQVGLDTVAVLEAAYESARTGATVAIADSEA